MSFTAACVYFMLCLGLVRRLTGDPAAVRMHDVTCQLVAYNELRMSRHICSISGPLCRIDEV